MRSAEPDMDARRSRDALAAALEQLRFKLLDLTARNRLLNFRPTPGRSLQSVEGGPQAIYDRLVEGIGRASIRVHGLPEPPRSDWKLRDGRYVRPDTAEWAVAQRISTDYDLPTGPGEASFGTLLYPEDLAKHCRKLEREANLAIEETGANMLFLVLGFLQFPDQEQSDRSLLAPLISVPVSLSGSTHDSNRVFEIEYTGDEVAANLSLYEKLRVDHGLALPEFDEEAPDIEGYFREVKRVVERRPGYEVKRRVTLCLLSFTNMLLVRDLDPNNWPTSNAGHALLDHPVITRLFEGQGDDGGSTEATEHDVDEDPGATIPLVFDADSSQHRALIDILHEGRNLVIEGPPGTGKSQTITNLIAACIRDGKSVLFVSEKLAALEVVKSRLSTAGLDPFVLELHSSKTSKKRVLEEIGRRMNHRVDAPSDLPHKLEQLERYRQKLRSYANLLKSVAQNSLGLTVHSLIWRAEGFRLRLTSEYVLKNAPSVRDASKLTLPTLNQRSETLKHLADQFKVITRFDESSPFWGFYPEELLPGDEHTIQRTFETALPWLATFCAQSEAYAAVHGPPAGLSKEQGRAQLEILQRLHRSAPVDGPLHLVSRLFSGNSTARRVKELVERVAARQERYRQLNDAVKRGLLSEADGTADRLQELRNLDGILQAAGVTDARINALIPLAGQSKAAADSLGDSLSAIRAYCESNSLPFTGSRDDLQRLMRLALVVKGLPDSAWKWFNTGLAADDATASLEALDVVQHQYEDLHNSLEPRIYLDAIPDAGTLREAILTLREGPAWYRMFQRRWRQARALHRRVQRKKVNTNPELQLAGLESLHKYLNLRDRWRSDPAWAKFCQHSMPEGPIDLGGHLTIARWYDAMRQAFGALGVPASHVPLIEREQAPVFRRDYFQLETTLNITVSNLAELDAALPRLGSLPGGKSAISMQALGTEFASAVGRNLRFLTSACPKDASVTDCAAACDAACQRRAIAAELASNSGLKHLLADHYRGLETDVAGVLRVIEWAQQVHGSALPASIRLLLLGSKGRNRCVEISRALQGVIDGLSNAATMERALQEFGACDLGAFSGQKPGTDVVGFAKSLYKKVSVAAEHVGSLVEWSMYVTRRGEALAEDLGEFVTLLESERVALEELPAAYGYAALGSIIRGIFRDPALSAFSGLKHGQTQSDFRRIDKEIIEKRGLVIADSCLRRNAPPAGRGSPRVDEKTEMALLNHLLPQQRPRVPVRQILARASEAVRTLKPCLMMGPHAVAQFLTPGGMTFDLVIMDEASQLSPEEAIGAIARGRQLVVVGDSKQLPSTNFFRRQNQLGEDAEEYTTTDAESILDICAESFKPSRYLLWHYRSRHHSLIAFSNHQFYDGRLIVCPSPYAEGTRLGVRATYLAHAIYENQINPVEANRVVDAVVEHIVTRPDESLGVVTLNIKQRDLILELLDERLRDVPEAEEVRSKWRESRQDLFVKNLENVQGDERDCIIISTTFGRPPGVSKPRQNFGPISRQGGWRRLNVLFTRARNSVAVFTSLRPDDIVIDASTPDGTKALRAYLEFARSGQVSVAAVTGLEPDSDFERAVIEVLRRMNYDVTPQLGVSGFRIDIAIKHPAYPGSYLAAIECDGAQYHSAQSARDRDRIRQEILESHGWRDRIWRIWSTDWFRAPAQETAKLKAFLDRLRETWKPEHTGGQSWVEEGTSSDLPREAVYEEQTATVRHLIDQKLFDNDADKEVRVGDIVDYLDTAQIDDVKSVRLTKRNTVIEQGLIAEHTPLAQALLGSVVGDDVTLSVPGNPKRILRILAIKRDVTA